MIRIGTRKSSLAMAQTEIVKRGILKAFPEETIEIVPILTEGDRVLDKSLASFGGKGVFTRELERELLEGTIDMAVHSAKDMPMEFPKGLELGAVLSREDPRDVLVTTSGIEASKLPPASVIGTSSLRREIQIKNINPQLQVRVLRGNVSTRLEKLRQGMYDGILLAAAGLKRLGLCGADGLSFEYLAPDVFVPAAGQGILAVETRAEEFRRVLKAIHSPGMADVLEAEREFLTLLGGSCNAPCGALCEEVREGFAMTAMYAADGKSPSFFQMSHRDNRELARRLAVRAMAKPVSLLGAGPGDPGLMGGKALMRLRAADVVVYDNLIPPSALNEAPLDAELIYAGKRFGSHHMSQEEINALLVKKALEGKRVVRLKGGDPYVFGRGGEEAWELEKNGIPFEIVPGVSSSVGALAYAGIPVTHRALASSFHVITGHEMAGRNIPVLDYGALAVLDGTLVFLMGLHSLGEIAEKLISHGKRADTPAAVIQNGTTPLQKVVTGTLGDIAARAREEGMKTPAVAVVGDVVSLAEHLTWYGKGPLSGKRILITGTRHMAEQLERQFRGSGAELAAVSLIETKACGLEELRMLAPRIGDYGWLVFTSANGVNLFFDSLLEWRVDFRKLSGVRFATVGSGSRKALEKRGFQSDFTPSRYTVADMAVEWVPGLKGDERVMLLRAKEGSKELGDALRRKGIEVTELSLYATVRDNRRSEELMRLIADADYVTVTSASGARALADMWRAGGQNGPKVISIGPVTAKAAREAGLTVHMTAAVYNAEGIWAAVVADLLSQTGAKSVSEMKAGKKISETEPKE